MGWAMGVRAVRRGAGHAAAGEHGARVWVKVWVNTWAGLWECGLYEEALGTLQQVGAGYVCMLRCGAMGGGEHRKSSLCCGMRCRCVLSRGWQPG